MPPQYLLPCKNCDHLLEVVPKQAGQDLKCPQCQHHVEAPMLGKMKQLEMVAGTESARRPSSSGRQVRNLIFVAGLLLAIIGGAAGAFLYVYANQMIWVIDFDEESETFNQGVDQLTADELIQLYETMQIEAGLGEWYEPNFIRYNTQGKILLNFSYILLGIGVLGALMMGSCLFIRR